MVYFVGRNRAAQRGKVLCRLMKELSQVSTLFKTMLEDVFHGILMAEEMKVLQRCTVPCFMELPKCS